LKKNKGIVGIGLKDSVSVAACADVNISESLRDMGRYLDSLIDSLKDNDASSDNDSENSSDESSSDADSDI
jgi:hypothetical protein